MSRKSQTLELWGGVECTVNRVADRYFEQLDRSGHTHRIEDLDRFAEIGISALRQAVIWERVCARVGAEPDWSWSDRWLGRVRELNIKPIVGLVHHGSGPAGTDLLDPEFPEKLAGYAQQVARRYPWVDAYTPVNEPLTTARFSGLYGHWYPHGRNDSSFVRTLLNECRGVVLAIRDIREVNPDAELVQTDDLGRTFSTPELGYQADFDNERRWLAFDLLMGRMNAHHALWPYLLRVGASESDLMWFAENPCIPSVLGFNYYLSSERFLDHRTDLYPSLSVGGNGRHCYIDTESARARLEGIAGGRVLLREAWERFHMPLAITECHNGCTREEQMRWLLEVWRDTESALQDGVDVRAVTLWSLLGAFDWNTLVTCNSSAYEPGVFDIRAPYPWRTALAPLATELASGAEPTHPLLSVPGWWGRDERLVYGFGVTENGSLIKHVPRPKGFQNSSTRPLLITGGRGTLGRAFERACVARGIPYKLVVRSELDIADQAAVHRCLADHQPWAIINAAGYVRVDEAESDSDRCHRENTNGPAVLASECRRRGIQFVTFSSDLVFDGDKRAPYKETDNVRPLNQYGSSKAKAEQLVVSLCPDAFIVRTSAFFSPWDVYNFVTIALQNIAAGREFRAAADVTISPTYVPDLVNSTLDLMIDGANGIWHLANAGETSWATLATMAAELKGHDSRLVRPCSISEFKLPAPRPPYSVLGSERSTIMPTLDNALARYIIECPASLESTEPLAA